MKHIEAPAEILSLLAAELGAGRTVDIPGLGRFSVQPVHADVETRGATLRVSPPGRTLKFTSEPRASERDDADTGEHD